MDGARAHCTDIWIAKSLPELSSGETIKLQFFFTFCQLQRSKISSVFEKGKNLQAQKFSSVLHESSQFEK